MEVLIILLFICIAGIIFFKVKQNDNSIQKRDSIEFDTQKSVAEITNALRSLNCQMMRLNDDPLANGQGPAIAVRCYGDPKFTDKFKHVGGAVSVWGVDVIVTDLGNRRHVELDALGHSVWGNTKDNKGFGIGFSREYRDKIAEMLA